MGGRKRILVIDDASLMRLVVKNLLVNHPELEVVGEASNGIEGLDKIGELQPDLVTLDLEMPEMDGLETLKRIRLQYDVKVVVLSSAVKLSEEARVAGADGVFLKPSGNVSFDMVENSGPQIVRRIYELLELDPPAV